MARVITCRNSAGRRCNFRDRRRPHCGASAFPMPGASLVSAHPTLPHPLEPRYSGIVLAGARIRGDRRSRRRGGPWRGCGSVAPHLARGNCLKWRICYCSAETARFRQTANWKMKLIRRDVIRVPRADVTTLNFRHGRSRVKLSGTLRWFIEERRRR